MRLGQYEEYDPGLWEGSIYYEDIPMEGVYDFEEWISQEWPSETRFMENWIEQGGTAEEAVAQLEAAGTGGGFVDIIKSIFGIVTPVAISALTASQKAAAQQAALQKALTTTSIGTSLPTTLGAGLTGLTSSLPLLAGIGILGYFIFRGKGNNGGPRRRSRRRK